MSATPNMPLPGAAKALKKRFDHDIYAECRVAAAALFRPEFLAGQLIPKGLFHDQVLAELCHNAKEIQRAGGDVLRELPHKYPRTSWFWLDPEMDGPNLLWHLWDEYSDQARADVDEALKRMRDLSVRRAQ